MSQPFMLPATELSDIQGDGLSGAGVRQAEKDDVRAVQELLPLRQVMALVLIDPKEDKVLPGSDPFVDLQACGAGLAVDIDFCFHI